MTVCVGAFCDSQCICKLCLIPGSHYNSLPMILLHTVEHTGPLRESTCRQSRVLEWSGSI